MAGNQPEPPLFIDGDHQVPPGSTVDRALMVSGVLRVGAGCTCTGDLFGAEGIELGHNVTVQGSLFSHGEITWGQRSELSGTIYSKMPKPRNEALVRAGLHDPSERELPMLQTVSSDTVQLLLEIAWDGHQKGVLGYPDSWWGLGWDETAEVVERFLASVDGIYRGGLKASRWTPEEVVDTVFLHGLSQVIPLSVQRRGPKHITLKVGRPSRSFDPSAPLPGWPWPTVSLLNLVGHAACSDLRLVFNGAKELLTEDANPVSIEVTLEVGGPHARL